MERSERKTRNWLVTYSDLITLLLVFFVLLYMMTPGIDQSRFDSFMSYFQRSIGVMDHTSIMDTGFNHRELAREQIMEQWEIVEQYLIMHQLSDGVRIEEMDDGVKITLHDDLTFESGSSDLLPAAMRVLDEVSRQLSAGIGQVDVEGHTDNVPISSRSTYRTNWHLGAARAVEVVLYMQGRADLESERYQAVSFGEYRPIAENSSAEGRRQNRRVEIYLRYPELMLGPDIPGFQPEQSHPAE